MSTSSFFIWCTKPFKPKSLQADYCVTRLLTRISDSRRCVLPEVNFLFLYCQLKNGELTLIKKKQLSQLSSKGFVIFMSEMGPKETFIYSVVGLAKERKSALA